MNSLRGRLFAILVAATGLIWLSAVVWIYFGTKSELEHVLDTRLQEAARMVNSLIASGDLTASRAASVAAGAETDALSYERQLSCQIWSLNGQLVARSDGAPDQRLADDASGFSDHLVGGVAWRIYAIENKQTGFRVMVGDRLGLRDKLVGDLIMGLIAPILLVVPALAFLIWGSLGRGLRPLLNMATDLHARSAEDMRPLDAGRAPGELRPLAQAINGLFDKVEAARRHERDVTAFAAHELRTPLAGLKVQAQIALASNDKAVRHDALRQILTSVDRTSRLVRQLLVLAKLDATDAPEQDEDVDLGALLTEIAEMNADARGAIATKIDSALAGRMVCTNREILTIALRNLHENALAHSPEDGTVAWAPTTDGNGVAVTDNGPGIPAEELALVAQRFYRGRHRSKTGSGLGLTIVETAAGKLGARFDLENGSGGRGLTASFVLPPSSRSRFARPRK